MQSVSTFSIKRRVGLMRAPCGPDVSAVWAWCERRVGLMWAPCGPDVSAWAEKLETLLLACKRAYKGNFWTCGKVPESWDSQDFGATSDFQNSTNKGSDWAQEISPLFWIKLFISGRLWAYYPLKGQAYIELRHETHTDPASQTACHLSIGSLFWVYTVFPMVLTCSFDGQISLK